MTFLPVVGRELGVAARRAGTYWMRFAAAAVALGIFFVLFTFDTGSVTQLGEELFLALGVPTLGFTMLAGVFLTADCLSIEKREGTLGLLFLTDLKGYDVVLGKLAANSVHAFFGLLAVFPVLALPLLMGGVSGGEFWRCVLVFICTLYFSLSIGMLISAASREGRQAMAATFGLIVTLTAILPVLWLLLSQSWVLGGGSHNSLVDCLLWPNPVFAYTIGFDDQYSSRAGRQEFWTSVAIILVLASACILAASRMLPRSWQKNSDENPAPKAIRFQLFSKRQKPRRRPPLGDNKPFFWLATGDRAGQAALNRIMTALLLLWAFCLVLGLPGSRSSGGIFYAISIFLSFGLHFTAKILMASESGRRFHQDRQSGAMELLLVTPLPVEAIVAQQALALRVQFKRLVWALTLVNILNLALILARFQFLNMDPQELRIFTIILLSATVMLWLDSYALAWLGMWSGLKAKSHPRSVLLTLSLVMGIPWLALFFFLFLAGVLVSGETGLEFCIALWFGLGVLVDFLAIGLAREKLLASFRPVIAQRHGG